jgi:hypothetical protein
VRFEVYDLRIQNSDKGVRASDWRLLDIQRDGFRESIIRCGVKIDNGLEKPNQGLKKAEKVKNSDQTSGSNLRARYTLTTARGAR